MYYIGDLGCLPGTDSLHSIVLADTFAYVGACQVSTCRRGTVLSLHFVESAPLPHRGKQPPGILVWMNQVHLPHLRA
jgi:hypothetical protein